MNDGYLPRWLYSSPLHAIIESAREPTLPCRHPNHLPAEVCGGGGAARGQHLSTNTSNHQRTFWRRGTNPDKRQPDRSASGTVSFVRLSLPEEPPGTSWSFLEHPGASWNTLEPPGTSRSLLEPP